ncbi:MULTISPECIES: hypothetical protein [Nocardiaceae]|uniref:hypothetical protein n=1 Tax=Nocardiaceae TaxID=85025 RepID=UPI000B03FF1B|nr:MULTISPECIES: hypothetical protein [Rhodococcus]MBY4014380.1 hypothetical protein [Rhodococcus fascians]MBY4022081.1 hypothetical protein [Rhodococcus fascians]MDQ0283505.1 hypothetical protein [Rhodococcus fascians]NIL84478.1 hypothetical protein [Rhodococcus fascians]
MRKYRVIMKNALGGDPIPLGLFDTLLEANTWIQDVGKRDEHELGTYSVEVEVVE